MRTLVSLTQVCGIVILGLLLSSPAKAVLTGVEGLNDASRIVKCGSKYFWYSTSGGIRMRWTNDPASGIWIEGPDVFASPGPTWWAAWNQRRTPWAPDVIYRPDRDEYHLYYCLSTPGINTSAIGLAVNRTLDPNDPNYSWEDRGIVVSSQVGVDNFNALDPCPVVTPENESYLAFGSFRGGIKLIRLGPDGMPHPSITTRWNLARQKATARNECEAASIYPGTQNGKPGYWLFVNWGGGISGGEKSTYQIRVGWSRDVRGPYLDKLGQDMYAGGGTVFMPTKQAFPSDGSTRIGRGHVGLVVGDALDGTYPDWVTYSYWLHHPLTEDGKRFGLQRLTVDADGWPAAGAVFVSTKRTLR